MEPKESHIERGKRIHEEARQRRISAARSVLGNRKIPKEDEDIDNEVEDV